jgi:hypothetical protein
MPVVAQLKKKQGRDAFLSICQGVQGCIMPIIASVDFVNKCHQQKICKKIVSTVPSGWNCIQYLGLTLYGYETDL